MWHAAWDKSWFASTQYSSFAIKMPCKPACLKPNASRSNMKVSDILRIKGSTLYTVNPDESLVKALGLMAERDIGSLVVMEHGDLVGMLTVRELTNILVKTGGNVATTIVRTAMDDHPLTCTMETDMDEVRRMMLDRHARYMPVMDKRMLMGVISFHDVARAVVDSQNFENKMLKAYIHDWPEGADTTEQPKL
jgi:CBS domain-containing protein